MQQYSDQELIAIARRYILESANPDMIAYGGAFIDELPRYLPQLRREARLVRSGQDRVLDVGCGFGWHAMLLSLITGARVTANDVRPTMTQAVDARCRALRDEGIPVRVRTLLGDACTLDLEPASFEVIACLQTMEHVHDPGAVVRCFARLLAPGGRILITNTNNRRNRAVVAENQRMWALRDSSQEYIDQLKRERPIENADIEPYAVMRRRIITELAPHLAGTDIDRLVHATTGQDRAQIAGSIQAFLRRGILPTRPPDAWCRNPETGEYCERLLDPFEIVRDLRAQGLDAHLQHRFNRWPLRLLNDVQWRPVNDMLFRLRPGFAVVGRKPPAPEPRTTGIRGARPALAH